MQIPHTVKAEADSDDEAEVFKHAFMVRGLESIFLYVLSV